MTSSGTMPEKGGGFILNAVNFFDAVPEGCVAAIIAFTTPTDACRLALVSRDFQSASDSDVVWEWFLPSEYALIVAQSDGGEALLAEFRKKQLYMRLADQPLLVDRASKSFWLEKSSGKKCWMFGARSLSTAWGDTQTYGKLTSITESRFPEVAELLGVCWLDISVRIQAFMLSPSARYVVYLVFNIIDGVSGSLRYCEASVRTGGGESTRRLFIDKETEDDKKRRIPYHHAMGLGLSIDQIFGVRGERFPRLRTDGWREVMIGGSSPLQGREMKWSCLCGR